MSCSSTDSQCRHLYLELLKKSLTGTLFRQEPNAEQANVARYIANFIEHYMNGSAVTMLPMCRLENIQDRVTEIVQEDIPGDLLEAGVWRGGATIFMRALLKVYGVQERKVWAADSFEGLPEPDAEKFPKEAALYNGPTIQKGYNRMAASLDEVRSNFRAYGLLDDQVGFIKGWFKDTLPTAPISQLSLLRLDGDYYDSTMSALINLYDKLAVGGVVIIDDYGEDRWTNCREAVDRFRAERSICDPLTRVDSKCYWWRRS